VITSNEDGHSRTNYTRSVHVLEMRNGRWQVVANAGNALSDAAQVMYLEHEWNDADMSGNSSWFDKNFASDMTNISSRTGKMTDKTEEMADFKSRKGVTTSAELSDLSARKEGDTVVVTGINRVKGKDGEGKAFDRRVAFTDVWVKRDSRWQVLATQGTDIK
jgi:ketosteroid isomerase-like protein